jgi:hypothetical protein
MHTILIGFCWLPRPEHPVQCPGSALSMLGYACAFRSLAQDA